MNYAAETSLGVVTIRAFNVADKFFENYVKLIDSDARLFFYSNAAMEWLVLRIEALQNFTLFTAAFLLVLLPKGFVAPGNITSLALSILVARSFQTVKNCYSLFLLSWLFEGLVGLSFLCSITNRHPNFFHSMVLLLIKLPHLS